MAFDPGDIVQLKSGGPAMTVVSEGPDGVHCLWHANPVGDLKTAVIPAVCLDILDLDDLDDFDIEDLEDEDDEADLELDDEPKRKPKPQ